MSFPRHHSAAEETEKHQPFFFLFLWKARWSIGCGEWGGSVVQVSPARPLTWVPSDFLEEIHRAGWRNLDHRDVGRSFFPIRWRFWSSTLDVGLIPNPKALHFLELSCPSSCCRFTLHSLTLCLAHVFQLRKGIMEEEGEERHMFFLWLVLTLAFLTEDSFYTPWGRLALATMVPPPGLISRFPLKGQSQRSCSRSFPVLPQLLFSLEIRSSTCL